MFVFKNNEYFCSSVETPDDDDDITTTRHKHNSDTTSCWFTGHKQPDWTSGGPDRTNHRITSPCLSKFKNLRKCFIFFNEIFVWKNTRNMKCLCRFLLSKVDRIEQPGRLVLARCPYVWQPLLTYTQGPWFNFLDLWHHLFTSLFYLNWQKGRKNQWNKSQL